MAKSKKQNHQSSNHNSNRKSVKKNSNKNSDFSSASSNNNNNNNNSSGNENKPRNHLIQDATSPYTFSFTQFGGCQTNTITVNQTPADETWPGGALWDIGVLLSKLLVILNTNNNSKINNRNAAVQQNVLSRLKSPGIWPIKSWKECTILELGCGVGLTGLVGASLGSKLTVLTDLDVVVDKVTKQNLELNSKEDWFGSGSTSAKVIAMPLCWGNNEDELECARVFENNSSNGNTNGKMARKKTKKTSTSSMNSPQQKATSESTSTSSISSAIYQVSIDSHNTDTLDPESAILDAPNPDIILIGDVAYQHKPGMPSHFDDLLSTLLKFTNIKESTTSNTTTTKSNPSSSPSSMKKSTKGHHKQNKRNNNTTNDTTNQNETVVVFGTRMRMPASMDLLLMFREHFDEVVNPPLEAQEIDDAFHCENLGKKSMITLHVFKRKKRNS